MRKLRPHSVSRMKPGPVQRALFLAQDDVRLTQVHVLHHRGHEGTAAHEFAAERPRTGKFLTVGHQRDQHLAALMPHAHHGMAHKARVRVFAIGQKAETRHEIAHRCDDGLRLLVFQQARVGGNRRCECAAYMPVRISWRGAAARAALPLPAVRPSLP